MVWVNILFRLGDKWLCSFWALAKKTGAVVFLEASGQPLTYLMLKIQLYPM